MAASVDSVSLAKAVWSGQLRTWTASFSMVLFMVAMADLSSL